MKIYKLRLDFQPDKSVRADGNNCYLLILAKSPAVIKLSSGKQDMPKNSLMICRADRFISCSGVESSEPVSADCITFEMTHSDLQYMKSLNIPEDSPMTLTETVVIHDCISAMYTQQFYKEKLNSEFFDHALRMIMINISNQIMMAADPKALKMPHYCELLTLRERIYASPTDKWNIDEIAAGMKVSRSYLHRLYMAAFGISCKQDIINCRTDAAAKLLRSTDYSVDLVAERCGYDNCSHFMRQFKQRTGMTPTQYRKRLAFK